MRRPHLLITSAGRRAKLVEYFVSEFQDGQVSAADCNPLAPALYMAHHHFIVPKITHPDYIEHLLELCRKKHVTALLSLIDPELELLAAAHDRFEAIGVTVIVSPQEACALCFDKYAMYTHCVSQGIAHAKTYHTVEAFREAIALQEIDFPVFVKPRNGSASIAVSRVESLLEVERLFDQSDGLIVQEFLNGPELGVDVYVDLLSQEVTSIFIKEKLVMRAGETDKSRSVVRTDVFELVEHVLDGTGLVGPLDFDVFDVDGTLYLSEINPRFGGGYPHAYECGVNFPANLYQNLSGQVSRSTIGQYQENLYMMKHDTVTLVSAVQFEQSNHNKT